VPPAFPRFFLFLILSNRLTLIPSSCYAITFSISPRLPGMPIGKSSSGTELLLLFISTIIISWPSNPPILVTILVTVLPDVETAILLAFFLPIYLALLFLRVTAVLLPLVFFFFLANMACYSSISYF